MNIFYALFYEGLERFHSDDAMRYARMYFSGWIKTHPHLIKGDHLKWD